MILWCVGSETLKQAAQRSCAWPILGSVQRQDRQDFEQPYLAKAGQG